MPPKPDKSQTAVRLALCGAAAAGLYAAARRLPQLEPYRPWLEEHKMEAIALAAAALFLLSLAVLPPEEERPPEPDGGGACDGYERTEDLL